MQLVDISEFNYKEEEITEISFLEDDTFDIEVEDEHHYILENGIVSHNTSIYAGIVSGGLEPIFMLEYDRWVIQTNRPDNLICPKYWEGEFEETEHFKFSKMGDEDILRGVGEWSDFIIDKNRGLVKRNTVRDYALDFCLENNLNISEDAKCTTNNLTIEDHIKTMSIFAKYVDSAISKTVNIPNNYSFEDFEKLYYNTWKSGIKGITTYRAGTMTAVLTAKEEKEKDTLNGEEIIQDSIKLPDNYDAKGIVLRAEGKKWYLHTSFFSNSNRPFAIFVSTNNHEPVVVVNNAIELLEDLARSKGIPDRWVDETLTKCKSQSGAIRIARMISLCLRHGILIRNIVSTLDKVDEAYVSTFVFAIKKYLSSFIKDGEEASGICQECGSKNMVYQEGCKKCNDCGNSLCG